MRIAVPMMGKEAETLMRQARAIAAYPGVDMAEWRADTLERALTPDAVCVILPALLRALAGTPMIFTLRTEGGAVRRALDRRGVIALPGCGGVDCQPACPGLPGNRLAP